MTNKGDDKIINTAEMASILGVRPNRVAVMCRQGYIQDAIKDDDGRWMAPTWAAKTAKVLRTLRKRRLKGDDYEGR